MFIKFCPVTLSNKQSCPWQIVVHVSSQANVSKTPTKMLHYLILGIPWKKPVKLSKVVQMDDAPQNSSGCYKEQI